MHLLLLAFLFGLHDKQRGFVSDSDRRGRPAAAQIESCVRQWRMCFFETGVAYYF
jgi:hypothetical protein